MIQCNICEKMFVLNTKQSAINFCKHVSKCPLRSNNELQERFSCNICRTSFQIQKSFQTHILKNHVDISESVCVSNTIQHPRNIVPGKCFVYI